MGRGKGFKKVVKKKKEPTEAPTEPEGPGVISMYFEKYDKTEKMSNN